MTVAVLASVSLAFVSCSRADEALPDALIGRWETDAAGYEGRFLEIEEGLVSFGRGDEATDYGMIARVESKAADGPEGPVWQITWSRSDGTEAVLSLRHDPRSDELHFAQRGQVWTRATQAAGE